MAERDCGIGAIVMPDGWWFANPKGIAPSSPRLPSRRGYLGSRCGNGFNRNAVAANVARDAMKRNGRNRVAVGNFVRTLTQGSSCHATLGFGTESRWDSKTAFNPQQPDIPRVMEIAKKIGLEFLPPPGA